jgi:hypothetical protein
MVDSFSIHELARVASPEVAEVRLKQIFEDMKEMTGGKVRWYMKNDWWYEALLQGQRSYDDDWMGPMGFKIHVPVLWSDTSYLEEIQESLGICVELNKEHRYTKWKIKNPKMHVLMANNGDSQAFKNLVIYPNELENDLGTSLLNLPEALRIAGLLKPLYTGNGKLQNRIVQNDLPLGGGVFLRFGEMSMLGASVMPDLRHLSFWEQIRDSGIEWWRDIVSNLKVNGFTPPPGYL